MYSLSIEFRNEQAMRDWFVSAQAATLFAPDAGVRAMDALDTGRAHPGSFIVSGEPGAGGFLIAPADPRSADQGTPATGSVGA
jgi:hypothetical protein